MGFGAPVPFIHIYGETFTRNFKNELLKELKAAIFKWDCLYIKTSIFEH